MEREAEELLAPYRGVSQNVKNSFRAAVTTAATATAQPFQLLLAVIEASVHDDVLLAHCACEVATALRKAASAAVDVDSQLASVSSRAVALVTALLTSEGTPWERRHHWPTGRQQRV